MTNCYSINVFSRKFVILRFMTKAVRLKFPNSIQAQSYVILLYVNQFSVGTQYRLAVAEGNTFDLVTIINKKKGKTIPVTDPKGPYAYEISRLPHFL
jgi:hypothetical protein